MTSNAMARLAGILYFATLPTAGFAYGYVAFMPQDDPAALLNALQAGREVIGWTIVLGAAGFVDYLVIAALFHRLFASTSKVAADLMVLLVASSVPLSLMALAQRMDLVALLDAAPQQLPGEAMMLLQSEAHLFQVSSIFWGLWMMPLGWLAYRSGLVPKLIGIGLIAGGFGYVTAFALPVLEIDTTGSPLSGALMALTLTSELAFIFWLIVKGAKTSGDEHRHRLAAA